jgi:hypothetical protein
MASSISPVVRRAKVYLAVILLAGVSYAQSNTSNGASDSAAAYSSSQAGMSQLQFAELSAPALPAGSSAASSGGGAAGQYGSGGGHGFRGVFHHWAFEGGAGFNAPVGNDTPYITWGGNITLGAGLRFGNRLSALAEYQYMHDKIPGPFISAFASDGVTSGSSDVNSVTGSPVIDLFPKRSNGIYLVGGWGWYHKSTNLQGPQETFSAYYGLYYQTVNILSFTSNQWGGNAGLGIYRKVGNVYGDKGHDELFAEARYTFIHTPPITQSNGLGTTELIPVTLGVRF